MDKEYLIKKWLADDLSEEELDSFKKLEGYDVATNILESAKHFKASEASEGSEVEDVDAFYAKIHTNKNAILDTPKWFSPLLRIAALLIVGFGVSLYFFLNDDSTVNTLASQKITIELPDNSSVIVNSKSELVFNEDKWRDKRVVNLDGEAFFNVTKGSKFDVITSTGKVTVLGTQFNVKSREAFFEVQCFEGSVSITSKGKIEILSAGDTYRILEGVITLDSTKEERPKWINNVSSFRSVPFYEVINEFERQYEVAFSLDNIDTKRIFTGGFVHGNLEEGLKSITLPLELTYSIDKNNHITLQKNNR